MSKTCSKCKISKELDQFYKDKSRKDGLQRYCKECSVKIQLKYQSSPEGKAIKAKWKATDGGKAIIAKWRASPEGKVSNAKWNAKYELNNQIKRKAQSIVNNAIAGGKIERFPCEVCQTNTNIHAHHCDYAHPLVITWLCTKHHTAWHKEHGSGLNG
jgi:hypothetical protein